MKYKYRLCGLLNLVITLFLILSCASTGPPGGGPADETAPRITKIIPEDGAINIDPGSRIEIEFSEPVNQETVEEALFISPPPEGKVKIKVRGNRVIIKPGAELPSDKTLVVTVGTGVKDLHGNLLEDSYSAAMSVGDRIDRGRIHGRVFGKDQLQGVLIGAWEYSDTLVMRPDSLTPPYLTQTGVDGSFSLDYLAAGKYRVCCWDDRNRDRKYDPGSDRIGLPWSDLVVESDQAVWLELFPVKIDTTRRSLLLVSAPDNKHVELRFSRKFEDQIPDIREEVEISDSTGFVNIGDYWIDPLDSARIVIAMRNPLLEGSYNLKLEGDTTSYEFTGAANHDTTGVRIIGSYPKAGDRNIPVLPEGWISFSDGLGDFEREGLIELTVNDSIDFPIRIWQSQSNRLSWTPLVELPPAANCSLSIDMSIPRDMSYNVSSDSLWFSVFRVLDPAEMGAISGTVKVETVSNMVVNARQISGKASELTTRVRENGEFLIENVIAGKYILWTYRDTDKNGKFNFGKLEPFSFSEKFTIGEDTLIVRERWESGGTVINWKD